MADDETISPKDFGTSFRNFLEQVVIQPREDPPFARLIGDHLGTDPRALQVVSQNFAQANHPNVHLALQDYLGQEGRSAELRGISGPVWAIGDLLLAARVSFGMPSAAAEEGPVKFVNVELSEDETIVCLNRALLLIRDGERRLAVYLQGPDDEYTRNYTQVDVLAADRAHAEELLTFIRNWLRSRNIYRGRVLSLVSVYGGSVEVKLHRVPTVERDQIVLPDGVLERVERQTIRFGELAGRLRAAGRHLSRGLLLHGPPGTGKTLTAMYLASRMPERTVLVLTGTGVGLIQQSCTWARLLQPATIVLEDVDLVAQERTRPGGEVATPLLFELLNQMDGFSDDADVLFLLTTNRPDVLEPALAARPGRVDMAIEIPLPDAPCRRRLFELYGRGLAMRLAKLDQLVERTKGVSAAFIRELLRKAALLAAESDPNEVVVTDEHLDDALRELLVEGGELTATLLGARRKVGFTTA